MRSRNSRDALRVRNSQDSIEDVLEDYEQSRSDFRSDIASGVYRGILRTFIVIIAGHALWNWVLVPTGIAGAMRWLLGGG